MGWMTKKSYGWEMKRMVWPIISILAFLPLPIHIFPFAFIAQGCAAKVRAWVTTGIVFLAAEVAVLVLCLLKFRQIDLETLSVSVVSIVSYLTLYLIGNILLIRNLKPYMQRLELSEIMELEWTNSLRTVKKWQPKAINSPQSFISQLLLYRNEIANAKIKSNIDKIIHYFRVIVDRDQERAEILVVRHQTILTLLGQYKSIQTSRIYNQVTVASRNDIETTLDKAVVAVEQEVTNQYEAELLEVSAEKDVYLQQLKNRDLLK